MIVQVSEMIEFIIFQFTCKHSTCFCAGETPLHLAARFGHRDAVKSLLEAGADPNLHDITGRTPLDAGVAADAVDVVKVNGNYDFQCFVK